MRGGGPAAGTGAKQPVGHNRLLALVAWGCREAARASGASAVAKALFKEGLGCLSRMASGMTQRQRTFWKGELAGKDATSGSRVNHCFDASDN